MLNISPEAQKLVRHFLGASKIELYEASLSALGTNYDLVHSGGVAITGEGTLVAVGYRASAAGSAKTIEEILTNVDGGGEQTTAAVGDAATNPLYGGLTRTSENLIWLPMQIEFLSSLKVRVKSSDEGSGTGYAYALVRKLV